jgi:hypothetical protein
MRDHRFGRKIKLPSTVAIKYELLTMMVEDEIRALPPGELLKESESPALAMLQRLRGSSPACRSGDGAAIALSK